MTQIAQVKEVFTNGRAQIAVLRKGACSHDCSKCGGCTPTAALPTILATAENGVGARVGDTVMVESDSAPILGMAAVLYLVPMILLIAGYVLGQILGFSETGSIGTAALAFFVSIALIILLDRHVKKSKAVSFKIIQIKGV